MLQAPTDHFTAARETAEYHWSTGVQAPRRHPGEKSVFEKPQKGNAMSLMLKMFCFLAPVFSAAPLAQGQTVLLTPKPGPAPRINGPLVYGCRPGHPFLYRIPTQGQRPIQFSAQKLPATLRLDPHTGLITGTAPDRGSYQVTLSAKNRHGKMKRPFKIVSGDTLALTPPHGLEPLVRPL